MWITTSVRRIPTDGRCSGDIQTEAAETVSDGTELQTDCTARLSLELVWEA
jgi:hypothetical protein